MSYSNASTIMLNGLSLTAGSSPAPSAAPKGLIATRAVEMKDGWVGQLIVADDIVWESAYFTNSRDAEEAATERAIKKIKKVLA